MMEKLPPELLHLIIRKYCSDTRSLATLSLVAYKWFHICRPLLFSSLELQLYSHVETLEFVRPFPPSSTISYALTPCVLDSGHHIRRIALNGRDRNARSQGVNVISQLSQYGGVQLLSLRSMDCDRWVQEPLVSAFQDIVQLEILHVLFDNFTQLVDFILSYPNLEVIVLHGVWCSVYDGFEGPWLLIHSSPTLLKALAVDESAEQLREKLFSWLMSGDRTSPIQSIRLHYFGENEISLIARYLRFLGPKLEHLAIGWECGRRQAFNTLEMISPSRQ